VWATGPRADLWSPTTYEATLNLAFCAPREDAGR